MLPAKHHVGLEWLFPYLKLILSLEQQINVTRKYSVQGQSLKGKVRYTNGNYILQGEAKASAKALDGFRASVSTAGE